MDCNIHIFDIYYIDGETKRVVISTSGVRETILELLGIVDKVKYYNNQKPDGTLTMYLYPQP